MGRQPLSFASASSDTEEVRLGDEGQLPFTLSVTNKRSRACGMSEVAISKGYSRPESSEPRREAIEPDS